MAEIYTQINGYNYQVSNYGNVINSKGKHIKPFNTENGYKRITLHKEGKQQKFPLHRLVYSTFNNDYEFEIDGELFVINHIDGNKQNNNLSNLEKVTQRENSTTCFRSDRNTKSSIYPGVSKEKNKWRARITFNNKTISLGYYETEELAHEAYKNKLKEYYGRD
jgi:hypothetical protein